MAIVHVQLQCPSGCGDTLVLDPDHHVVCSDPGCLFAEPGAVADLLELTGRGRELRGLQAVKG